MINAISGWAGIIISIILLAALVELLFPSDSFGKYVKFAVGLMLMAVVIRPVLSFSGMDFELDLSVPEIQNQSYMYEINRSILKVFENKLEQEIKAVIGVDYVKVEAQIDENGQAVITAVRLHEVTSSDIQVLHDIFGIDTALITVESSG